MKILRLWDNVNHGFVQYLIHILQVEENRSKKQLEIIQYSLTCIINEFGKMVLLAIVFTLQGCVDDYIIALFSIVSLRIYVGGSHRETTLGCFLQSLLVLEAIILFAQNIVLNVLMNYAIWILMLIWIWRKVPVISAKRARYNDFQCMRFKALALTTLFLHSMIVGIVPKHIANVMLWAIAIQLVESGMIVLDLRKEEKEKCKA